MPSDKMIRRFGMAGMVLAIGCTEERTGTTASPIDHAPGSDCRGFEDVLNRCAASRVCAPVEQWCDPSTHAWTACTLLSDTCPMDAGSSDAATLSDAATDGSMMVGPTTDAGPRCESGFYRRCTTSCGSLGTSECDGDAGVFAACMPPAISPCPTDAGMTSDAVSMTDTTDVAPSGDAVVSDATDAVSSDAAEAAVITDAVTSDAATTSDASATDVAAGGDIAFLTDASTPIVPGGYPSVTAPTADTVVVLYDEPGRYAAVQSIEACDRSAPTFSPRSMLVAGSVLTQYCYHTPTRLDTAHPNAASTAQWAEFNEYFDFSKVRPGFEQVVRVMPPVAVNGWGFGLVIAEHTDQVWVTNLRNQYDPATVWDSTHPYLYWIGNLSGTSLVVGQQGRMTIRVLGGTGWVTAPPIYVGLNPTCSTSSGGSAMLALPGMMPTLFPFVAPGGSTWYRCP